WKGWAILLRQKQKKLIMLPSETMIWQPEFTDKTLSRKPGAVQWIDPVIPSEFHLDLFRTLGLAHRAFFIGESIKRILKSSANRTDV
ncbi:hypothetical protein, partial [Escherichia albertii]|uniref:hypothetical protein n=1 Tax=Escherichia albertii TaxID=208962 RepID=UPI001A7E06A1